MSSNKERHPQLNHARRHFLGLAAATGARVAAMGGLVAAMLPLSAEAKGHKWWKGGKGGGKGHMCFLRGTSIMTSTGEVCIEDLKIGDRVETVRGIAMPIKWIGRHVYKRSGRAWNADVLPIRISQHALYERTPHRDLYISAGHALFIGGVLIRAEDLVNGTSIAAGLPADTETIEYFQIVLGSHEVLLAEGAPAESFLSKDNNHEGFTNFAEFARLYPAGLAMEPFAPIVSPNSGREHLKALLPAGIRRALHIREPAQGIYERIAARAEQLVS